MYKFIFIIAVIIAIIAGLWASGAFSALKTQGEAKEVQITAIVGAGEEKTFKIGDKSLTEAEYKTEKIRLIDKYKAQGNKVDINELKAYQDLIKIELKKNGVSGNIIQSILK